MEEAGVDLPGLDDGDERAVPLAHYSPIVARLDTIADRIFSVRTAVQANYTRDHQEPTFQPLVRPVTAIERERERRARTVLLETDALLRGGGLEIITGSE